MFHFTIRDLLWLMVVVGMACGWLHDRDFSARAKAQWQVEKAALIEQHVAAIANEKRVATLRALEAYGKSVSEGRGYAPSGKFGHPQSPYYTPQP